MTLWSLKTHHKRWIAILAGILIVGAGWLRTNAKATGRIALFVFGLVGAFWTPHEAFAQEVSSTTPSPSNGLPATEVEQLLLKHLFPDACQTDCVNIALSKLSVDETKQQLDVWMEVHAVEDAILTLPGPIDQWAIDSVLWKDLPHTHFESQPKGILKCECQKGSGRLILGPLNDGAQIHPPIQPHRMDTETGNWIVQGLLENGQLGTYRPTKSASTSSRLNHTD